MAPSSLAPLYAGLLVRRSSPTDGLEVRRTASRTVQWNNTRLLTKIEQLTTTARFIVSLTVKTQRHASSNRYS